MSALLPFGSISSSRPGGFSLLSVFGLRSCNCSSNIGDSIGFYGGALIERKPPVVVSADKYRTDSHPYPPAGTLYLSLRALTSALLSALVQVSSGLALFLGEFLTPYRIPQLTHSLTSEVVFFILVDHQPVSRLRCAALCTSAVGHFAPSSLSSHPDHRFVC